MDPTLRMVERFEELRQRRQLDAPYDYETIFPTGGYFVRRASQKKLELLKRLDEHLRAILKPGERVRYLTTGVLYSFLESYLLGAIAYYINLRALVLTTERILLIQITSRQRPDRLKSQILLGDVERIKSTAFGNTRIKLRGGQTYLFTHVPRRDRKALAGLLGTARGGSVTVSTSGAMENLCPHCYHLVAEHPPRCPSCGGGIKSPTTALRLSALFPGLGAFYLGYHKLGVFKMLLAAMIWVGVWLPDPRNPTTLAQRVPYAVAVLAIVHLFGVGAAQYLARKGHYPAAPAGARVVAATASTSR